MTALLSGLSIGAVAWFLVGRGPSDIDRLAAMNEKVSRGIRQSPTKATEAAMPAALFANSSPPPAVRLDGVSISPGRKAALLSVNDASPQWALQGATLGGFTLTQVAQGRVVIESVYGRRILRLGESSVSGPTEDGGPEGEGQPPTSGL